MDGWTQEHGLRWRALAPFGAEVEGDLAALSPEAGGRLVSLYRDAGLILARGQSLSMEQQIALMERFGPVLHRVDGVGFISTDQSYSGAHSELAFHSDYAFSDYPLEALSLHALDVVDGASSTRFVSARLRDARLPDELLARLEAHAADMISPNPRAFGVRTFEVREPDAMMHKVRPSVLAHPHTGEPCIHVSELHAARLLDMPWEESRDLLGAVYEHLYAPDIVLEHRWRNGDIVIWDNIAVQHARGAITPAARRVLQRVACGVKGLDELCPDILAMAAA